VVQSVITVRIAAAVPLTQLALEQVRYFLIGLCLCVLHVAEDKLDVEELGVNAIGRLIVLAHHEDLGRLISGRLGLGSLDLFEKLLEHPNDRVVVFGSEHFCDEPTTLL